MVVYPKIESWNEFYPSEIFIRMDDNEQLSDAFPIIKMANIGTTLYIGTVPNETLIGKKIGDMEVLPDLNSSMLMIGYVTYGKGGGV